MASIEVPSSRSHLTRYWYKCMPNNDSDYIKQRLHSLCLTADVFDRSFSFTDRGIESRALMGWYSQNASLPTLSKFALEWGVNPKLVESWKALASQSDGVGITYNANLTSLRLYTHDWNRVRPSEIGKPVYTGFKSLQDGSLRIDEYLNYGDLRETSNFDYASNRCTRPEWLERVVSMSPVDVPLIFTRTENSSRQSWLVTVRHANLDAGDIVGYEFKGNKLLHLAGGVDAVKGEFLTFYLSSSPNQVLSLLK